MAVLKYCKVGPSDSCPRLLHRNSRLKDMSQDASVQVEEHKGFCNHWSSYRLSLRQTWRELKLRPRSSINWMIDIFAGTITDPKADFTFCLNAGFYFDVFTWALIHAFY